MCICLRPFIYQVDIFRDLINERPQANSHYFVNWKMCFQSVMYEYNYISDSKSCVHEGMSMIINSGS